MIRILLRPLLLGLAFAAGSVLSAFAAELEVSSLADLARAAAQNKQEIRLKPGVYRMADYLTDPVLAEIHAARKGLPGRPPVPMLVLRGDDNRIACEGATIEIDTALYKKLPGGYVRCIIVAGKGNTITGLSIRNTGPNQGSGGNTLSLAGERTTLENVTLHVYGSTPYGYGDLLGKGGPNLVSIKKQSGIQILGSGSVLRRCRVFSLRGEGRIVVDGKAHILRPGCCALVRPYQFHNYIKLAADGFDWLFITFDIAVLPAGLGDGVVRRAPPGCDHELQELIACFHRAKNPPPGTQTHAPDLLAWRLATLLARLAEGGAKVRAAAKGQSDARERLLLHVHALVSANLGRHLSTHEMASALGVAESHLRATFRQAAGLSLGRFQRDLRLQHAAALLSRGEATVAEAAVACGWESPFAFSRAFSKYWKCPPKRFGAATV